MFERKKGVREGREREEIGPPRDVLDEMLALIGR